MDQTHKWITRLLRKKIRGNSTKNSACCPRRGCKGGEKWRKIHWGIGNGSTAFYSYLNRLLSHKMTPSSKKLGLNRNNAWCSNPNAVWQTETERARNKLFFYACQSVSDVKANPLWRVDNKVCVCVYLNILNMVYSCFKRMTRGGDQKKGGILDKQKEMTGKKVVWTFQLRTRAGHRWAVDEETTS